MRATYDPGDSGGTWREEEGGEEAQGEGAWLPGLFMCSRFRSPDFDLDLDLNLRLDLPSEIA